MWDSQCTYKALSSFGSSRSPAVHALGADYSVRSCLISVGITEGRWEVREDCDDEKENGHNEEGGGGGTLKLILFKFVWCNLK